MVQYFCLHNIKIQIEYVYKILRKKSHVVARNLFSSCPDKLMVQG